MFGAPSKGGAGITVLFSSLTVSLKSRVGTRTRSFGWGTSEVGIIKGASSSSFFWGTTSSATGCKGIAHASPFSSSFNLNFSESSLVFSSISLSRCCYSSFFCSICSYSSFSSSFWIDVSKFSNVTSNCFYFTNSSFF